MSTMQISFNKIVVLVAVVAAVAMKQANGRSMPLSLYANLRSKSSPMYYVVESPKKALNFIGSNERDGRFWAPWSSVSAFTKGRFHIGSGQSH